MRGGRKSRCAMPGQERLSLYAPRAIVPLLACVHPGRGRERAERLGHPLDRSRLSFLSTSETVKVAVLLITAAR